MPVRLKQLAQDGATDFQVPRWNNATGLWEPQNPVAPTQAIATATSGHTGASDTLVNSMTITPGAGDYQVSFRSSAELSANNSLGLFSIYVDGVQIAHSVCRIARGGGATSGAINSVTTQAFLTGVSAAEAIEIRAQISSGTMDIFERSLIVTRVG